MQFFVGALAARGATVGMFFTTNRFSSEATDAAQRVQHDIALVNGLKLTELMIRHRVGVQVARHIEIVMIDEDFFAEEQFFAGLTSAPSQAHLHEPDLWINIASDRDFLVGQKCRWLLIECAHGAPPIGPGRR